MLIWKMTFVFHKSKKAKKRITLNEIVNEDKKNRDSLLFVQTISWRSGYGADLIPVERIRPNFTGRRKFAGLNQV